MSTAVRPRKSAKRAKPRKSVPPGQKMPALVRRPQTGGALYTGGVPGNAGGRSPSWYLARVAEMLEAEMPAPAAADLTHDSAGALATPKNAAHERKALVLEFARDVVQGKYADATMADRLRAWKELADKVMSSKLEITLVSPEITSRLERQIEVINSRLTWTPSELLDALDPVWST